MAILNNDQLAEARRKAEPDLSALGTITHQKAAVNSALQAVEDWWENNKASLNTAVNQAISPVTFTVAQKKILLRVWMWFKFFREGGV